MYIKACETMSRGDIYHLLQVSIVANKSLGKINSNSLQV
jgi:hypothetical protein